MRSLMGIESATHSHPLLAPATEHRAHSRWRQLWAAVWRCGGGGSNPSLQLLQTARLRSWRAAMPQRSPTTQVSMIARWQGSLFHARLLCCIHMSSSLLPYFVEPPLPALLVAALSFAAKLTAGAVVSNTLQVCSSPGPLEVVPITGKWDHL
jgi:hypothetical protein